jgi:NADH:ubiquinone reductase (non-electrogenic)
MGGANGTIFAIGDCAATSYAPTAQVASQQGAYLARMLTQMAKKDFYEEKLFAVEAAAASVVGEEEKKQFAEEAEAAKRQLSKIKLRPFHYSHQGSLAYVSSHQIIDLSADPIRSQLHWLR